jgi:hypothetical protein
VALLGVAVGWPDPSVAVPAAMLVALLRWPADRRWAGWVLDGALLVGGLVAIIAG